MLRLGTRNGKKVTTRNGKRFGKYSELLKITDDPLSYVKEEIRKMNEETVSARENTPFPLIIMNGWSRQMTRLPHPRG